MYFNHDSNLYWRKWFGNCPIHNKNITITVTLKKYDYKRPEKLGFTCKFKDESSSICDNCPIYNK